MLLIPLLDFFLQKCLDLTAYDLTTLAKRSPDPPAGIRTGQIYQVFTTPFPKDLVHRLLYVKDSCVSLTLKSSP
jgi:hypothetical protein